MDEAMAAVLGVKVEESQEEVRRALTTFDTRIQENETANKDLNSSGDSLYSKGTITATAKLKSLTRTMDNVPFEMWVLILAEFLPPVGTVVQVTVRSNDQENLRLPRKLARMLSPLLGISKRFSASVASEILRRCPVLINQNSVSNSSHLLSKSRYLNPTEARYGFASIEKMEIKWAPMTAWNETEIQKFFKLLSKATGLITLKVYIPSSWWVGSRENIWKEELRAMLVNAPKLRMVELWKYEIQQEMDAGWRAFLSKEKCMWVEVNASVLERGIDVDAGLDMDPERSSSA